jgi:hypothetical protein
MLRQFALFLLVMCLTVPAVAAPACHQPEPCATMAMTHDGMDHAAPTPPMDDHRDMPMTVVHRDCVGCAALSPALTLVHRDTLPPLAARTPIMRALIGFTSAPDLPPPRA